MSELRVNSIEKRTGNNVSMSDPLKLKSYTTTERNALTAAAGDVIYNSTTNKVQFYNGSAWGDTGPAPQLIIEYLVVAGGGGGGGSYGSGGGAGGYRNSYGTEASGGDARPNGEMAGIADLSTNYVVSVGAGGPAGSGAGNGTVGNDSTFDLITSNGGGRGASNSSSGGSGGSGGGAGGLGGGAGSHTVGMGYSGSARNSSSYSGSGGGAGGAGTTQNSNGGGAPLSSSITGSSVARAGGGPGTGSSDQGGRGSANLGGGGGQGTAGDSGVVILRYPKEFTITVGGSLTSSTSTVGDDKVTTFTAGTDNVSWA